MSGKKPPASTLRWCQKEAGPILEGVGHIVRSQLGYEGRRFQKECSRKCLQTIVGGGTVVDPLNPSNPSTSQGPIRGFGLPTTANEVLERTNVIATGIKTFASLLASGIYPGSGGYTLSSTGEKIYGAKSVSTFPSDLISELSKVAESLQKGSLKLPNIPLPNLERMGGGLPSFGSTQQQEPPLFGADALRKGSKRAVAKEATVATASAVASSGLTPEEEAFLIKAAHSVGDDQAEEKLLKMGSTSATKSIYRPTLPANYSVSVEDNSSDLSMSKESTVPSTRIGRLATFGQLGVGLMAGAAAEVTRRAFGFAEKAAESVPNTIMQQNPMLSSANADRIVQTLCRVRGAALKLGQMLSIQDQETVPKPLLDIFERVRHSADFMPLRQVHKQMADAFGAEWRDKFQSFEDRPFAAASIGQVHKAVLKDGRIVAVKVQYPGVAEGIDSDINNIVTLLNVGGLFPKGMFLAEFVKVARRELRQECDYLREARAMKKFRDLVKYSEDFYVPEVIDELSSSRVLTSELVVGKPVDRCVNEPQVVRDYIAGKFVELCLHEIFVWRFMQTDPNWSNFFLGVHPTTGEPRLVLLDFGASRPYGKKFVDRYIQIIKAARDSDRKQIIEHSRKIGFLTGYETKVMEEAHAESVMIMGETIASEAPYDFAHQDVTKRIHKLVPVMLEHRLTAPPEEIYSMHRKLSGSYLLAAKLKATVSCGGLFNEIFDKYEFGEGRGSPDIDIDTVDASEAKVGA